MNLLSIRLTQPHNQNAAMRNGAKLSEASVCGYESPLFSLSDVPKLWVLQSLIRRSANVPHIVPEFPQMIDRRAWDILIDEDSHPQRPTSSIGVTCSSAKAAA